MNEQVFLYFSPLIYWAIKGPCSLNHHFENLQVHASFVIATLYSFTTKEKVTSLCGMRKFKNIYFWSKKKCNQWYFPFPLRFFKHNTWIYYIKVNIWGLWSVTMRWKLKIMAFRMISTLMIKNIMLLLPRQRLILSCSNHC